MDEVFNLLMQKRKQSKWHKEIHFVDLRMTTTSNDLATRWIDVFSTALYEKIYFYFLGINYQNLEKRVWENKSTRDFKIYNRFFQIGLYGCLKWFFLNPKIGYQVVTIDNIFSDAKPRSTNDRFHSQSIEEIEFTTSSKQEHINFNCRTITEINSDHEKEPRYPKASHFIQFVDIVSGSLSQIFDFTSVHEGKCLCAKKLFSYDLPSEVLRYDDQHFRSSYYKKFAVSFFPKRKLSKENILSEGYRENLFYTYRKLECPKVPQIELL